MADVVQQLRAEMHEIVNGRIDMLSSINTALQKCQQNQPFPSHTESATSFEETGKAAMTRDKFDTSCRTRTCECNQCQTKEKRCLSALRASTSSATAHLQWIVQVRSSEQSKRLCTNSCTEQQQNGTDNSATNTRAEGIRRVAHNCEEIRSEEHV